ncbi:patatin-like protein 1 [Panicum miliaceum]|uniref:Patatin n=1 Tax=Panicum miliaceum TaxID=4540 RepID=A0A3L6PKV0_PANMI|nr:patatin-like protein 1 [Panicum miliaceum]
MWQTTKNVWKKAWGGPKYDGDFLHKTIEKVMQDIKVKDTLSNIVVPTFDIKRMHPVLFNTLEAERKAHKNARLADICIATSAAPTFLPAHSFKTEGSDGRIYDFELIDGGVVANNPTMAAVSAHQGDGPPPPAARGPDRAARAGR